MNDMKIRIKNQKEFTFGGLCKFLGWSAYAHHLYVSKHRFRKGVLSKFTRRPFKAVFCLACKCFSEFFPRPSTTIKVEPNICVSGIRRPAFLFINYQCVSAKDNFGADLGLPVFLLRMGRFRERNKRIRRRRRRRKKQKNEILFYKFSKIDPEAAFAKRVGNQLFFFCPFSNTYAD